MRRNRCASSGSTTATSKFRSLSSCDNSRRYLSIPRRAARPAFWRDGSFGAGGVVDNPYGGISDQFGSSTAAGILTQLHDGARRMITVGARRSTSGVRELVIARHFYDDGLQN